MEGSASSIPSIAPIDSGVHLPPAVAAPGTMASPRSGEIGLMRAVGRIGRLQYFYRALPAAVISAVLTVQHDASAIATVVVLAASAFTAIQAVKRLHDLDLSGWWVLVGAIPVAGPLFGLWAAFTKGTCGHNRFGSDPLGAC